MCAASCCRAFKMATASVKIIPVLVLLGQICAANLRGTKCTIDVNKGLNLTSPLFLNEHSLQVIYPNEKSPSLLSFSSGQKELLYCPGGQLSRFNVITKSASEQSMCVGGQIFADSVSPHIPFHELACSKSPSPETREDTLRRCKDGVVVDIGYKVNDHDFWRTVDLCYVKSLATTSWAHSTIPGVIGGRKNSDFQAPAFLKGSYFKDVLMGKVYPKSSQLLTFMEIFKGNKTLVEHYLPQSGPKSNYLVKGHLVARADQFYLAEQYSTYFYVNVLPMWQSINNGNWKSVESTVRRVASNTAEDLDVWTGGISILSLSGERIYLTHDKKKNSRMLIPVPELLYKLVHNKKKNEALVFITINNPYVTEDEVSGYKICSEFKECHYKFKQFEHTFEGYTYCCLYGDFMGSPKVKDLEIPVNFVNPKPLALY